MKMKRSPAGRSKDLSLPEQLAPLAELSRNLWWSWDLEARALWASMDSDLWRAVEHNPVLLLRRLGRKRLSALAGDAAFVRRARGVVRRMRKYLRERTWYAKRYGRAKGLVAYFSMEFGLHESLPIFAGGLGVLAGDHFKSASDLGLPIVGVGMFWRHGYTRQKVDAKGRQRDRFDTLKPENLPFSEACDAKGRPIRIQVPVGSDTVVARAWRLDVGRTPVYFLDTNLKENAPKHRKLTDRLYSGDRDTRIRQECVLGIGGWRMLRALKLPVKVSHLNEGHAAFCALERVAERMEKERCSFEEASKETAATSVFTAHTPIPDGNEVFELKLAERYVGCYGRKLGIGFDGLKKMSRIDAANEEEPFGMTPLALRLSRYANGVSALHGEVCREMYHDMWPTRPVDRVPVGSITNGIHICTWLHPEMAAFLDEFLPADWRERQDSASVWKRIKEIPAGQLWQQHVKLKENMFAFVRRRLQAQLQRNGATTKKIEATGSNLDPHALTIGFARRFATYKRAGLIFHNLKRLEKTINNARRPVQLIFAGKAHPSDEGGKELVALVSKHAMSARFKGRIVFLEDYDMDVALHMVSGVDVWLNTPQRPREASGTSGMKPTLHGGLNLSILDGWWPEGCEEGKNGWAIGKGVDYHGPADNKRDAAALYAKLEKAVVPQYYSKGRGKASPQWVAMMKRSLMSVPWAFNSHRMVKEYLRKYYLKALKA
jgi:starch phosphorylase